MNLIEYFQKKGKPLRAEGNNVISLSPPGKMWMVEKDRIDIFCSGKRTSFPGHREHLFSVTENNVFFSLDDGGGKWEFIATGYPGTMVRELDAAVVLEGRNRGLFYGELEAALENWIGNLYSPLAGELPSYNRAITGETGPDKFEKGCRAAPEVNTVWLTVKYGSALVFNEPGLCLETGGEAFPLAPACFIRFREESEMEAASTRKILEQDRFLQILEVFHSRITGFYAVHLAETLKGEDDNLEKKDSRDNDGFSRSVARLSQVNRLTDRDISEGLGTRLEKVVKELETAYRFPLNIAMTETGNELDIVRDSPACKREVLLQGQWWRKDHGPMMGFTEKGEVPVALIPVKNRKYRLYDPERDERKDVTADTAESLKPFAYTFYRPFPPGPLDGKNLLKFTLQSVRASDLFFVFWIGITGAILGLILPVITGQVFDVVIPGAFRNPMSYIGILFLLVSAVLFIFHFTRDLAVLRIETLTDQSLQSAVWNRLLSLPANFFKRFTVGDLASRANSLGEIRERLSQNALSSVVSGVFSVIYLFLLFYYNAQLAWISVSLSLLFAVLFFLISVFGLRYERRIKDLDGKISGFLFQMINGIGKIRVSGSEKRVFALWEKNFSRKIILLTGLNTLKNFIKVVQSIFPVITAIALYFFFMQYARTVMTLGGFLAFNAAFVSFTASLLSITDTLLVVLEVIPLYERAKPIFQEQPEVNETKADPGELSGHIDVRDVCFRYSQESPPVLKNLSLSIRKGELIAIVGSSGSGKSTFLRILLGMETPDSGAVFYDGQNLNSLDIRRLRKKIGVVLQNGKIMPGDIYSNITGNSPQLTLEDAWAAAEMAGMAGDIRKMPMEMHTIVNEGGTVFSEGQRQRLLIAAAIVRKPGIFFFDEATSALDNRTQAVVMESIGRIRATRVVIAHRLSTIINADRILVMDHGEIVQEGTYTELMKREGLFRELVKRQML
ncbi:MAG: NHLP bacteriocin export ABC transporter permease/ATPase subunit [Spirochaetales bacterium]|nr:NHLP bacteriocin export ABC transporter permease/ATPase subunit [Spirochaetales bacterium]